MVDMNKYEAVFVLLDEARVPLEVRRSLIIRDLGPKLLEPLMDQSLDPGDMEKISDQIFEHIKSTAEFQKLISTRREQNKKIIELYNELMNGSDQDWEELLKAELAATSKNDILALAKAKNIKINITP